MPENTSPPPKPAPDEGKSPPILESKDLLAGHRAVHIRHAGELYRLVLTRNGKLILQK